jgi:hypothetical protein
MSLCRQIFMLVLVPEHLQKCCSFVHSVFCYLYAEYITCDQRLEGHSPHISFIFPCFPFLAFVGYSAFVMFM